MESLFLLNWLDMAIICVLLIGMIRGLVKGLIESIVNIAGVFIALFGAKYLTASAAAFVIGNTHLLNSVKSYIDKKIASSGTGILSLFKLFNMKNQSNTETLASFFISILCFIVLFLIIIILINIVKGALKPTFSHSPLKYLDRLGGAVLGTLIAAVFIFIFFAAAAPLTGVLPADKGLALAIGTSKFAKYFYLYNFVIPWIQKMNPII